MLEAFLALDEAAAGIDGQAQPVPHDAAKGGAGNGPGGGTGTRQRGKGAGRKGKE